jgi:hypothetical protein
VFRPRAITRRPLVVGKVPISARPCLFRSTDFAYCVCSYSSGHEASDTCCQQRCAVVASSAADPASVMLGHHRPRAIIMRTKRGWNQRDDGGRRPPLRRTARHCNLTAWGSSRVDVAAVVDFRLRLKLRLNGAGREGGPTPSVPPSLPLLPRRQNSKEMTPPRQQQPCQSSLLMTTKNPVLES